MQGECQVLDSIINENQYHQAVTFHGVGHDVEGKQRQPLGSKILFLNVSICDISLLYLGFPHSSVGKEPSCNAGDPDSIPGSGRSAE